MKDKSILISVGIIIYIVMSGIDRFVYHIPNVIYIPVAILGIILILIGFFKCQTAHCGRHKPHFDFGDFASSIAQSCR